MYQLIIAIIYYMCMRTLYEMHQLARRKATRDDKIAAITAYGIIAVTMACMLLLMIGGAANG